MELILLEFDYLYGLFKSTSKLFAKSIKTATPEQIRSIILCVDVCIQYKLLPEKYCKIYKNLSKNIELLYILSRNRVKVQAMVGLVLHHIVNLCCLTIQDAV